jgi:hypothetical protein
LRALRLFIAEDSLQIAILVLERILGALNEARNLTSTNSDLKNIMKKHNKKYRREQR